MADHTIPAFVSCSCGYGALDVSDAERHQAAFGSPGHDMRFGDEE